VRAYHGVLQAKGIKPKLPLEKDLELTDQTMSYEGGARRATVTVLGRDGFAARSDEKDQSFSRPAGSAPTRGVDWPMQNGRPDFDKMSAAERLVYDQQRLSRKFG